MRALDLILEGAIAVAVISISVLTFAQVIFRYVFSWSLAWSEELATFIMIWTALVGLGSMLRYSDLISFDLVLRQSRGIFRPVLRAIVLGSTLAFLLYLILYGFRMAAFSLTSGVSSALEIPLGWIYAAFPAGGIIALVQFWRRWRNGRLFTLDEPASQKTES